MRLTKKQLRSLIESYIFEQEGEDDALPVDEEVPDDEDSPDTTDKEPEDI